MSSNIFFYLTVGLKIQILSKWLDQMDQYASVSKREMTISSVPEMFRFGERIEMWISLKVQKTQAVVKYFNPV